MQEVARTYRFERGYFISSSPISHQPPASLHTPHRQRGGEQEREREREGEESISRGLGLGVFGGPRKYIRNVFLPRVAGKHTACARDSRDKLRPFERLSKASESWQRAETTVRWRQQHGEDMPEALVLREGDLG